MIEFAQKLSELERRVERLTAHEPRGNRNKYPLGLGVAAELDFNTPGGNAGWAWSTTAPFSTPNVAIDYAGADNYLVVSANTGRNFYRKITSGATFLNQSAYARIAVQHGASCGIRLDANNGDTDYVEFFMLHTSGVSAEWRIKQSTAGVATDTVLTTPRSDLFTTFALNLYAPSPPTWTPAVYVVQEDGNLLNIGGGSSATWTVTRVGIVCREDIGGSNFGFARCDWLAMQGFT
jgi:hypothetical protein